ncbi:heterokaryon incompatibility protein-domain-containing protein [Dendryphion nanum]|uniref:Heterokaryon incompatibility protein-domain-containing protein n=1 Tax=Dendryphion nanum TaxID=256645 RepID=A0A9P9ELP0_9PLEO|nr:heterokaryon incompatibility protein-domain-containing protein [Dendryphion nanum]
MSNKNNTRNCAVEDRLTDSPLRQEYYPDQAISLAEPDAESSDQYLGPICARLSVHRSQWNSVELLQWRTRHYRQCNKSCKFCQFIDLHIQSYIKNSWDLVPDIDLYMSYDQGLDYFSLKISMELLDGWASPRTIFSNKTPAKYVNYADIKQWLRICEIDHKETCARKRNKSICGLRMIDCTSRAIVDAPRECRYAALSYLWGKSNVASAPSIAGYLPTPAPQVIEDAIAVLRELGLSYLWVDRYCIDQNNPDTKHAQLQSMDEIYKMAEVTIIDAVGDSPDFGLCGVSKLPRSPSIQIEMGDCRLYWIPDVKQEVRDSPWSARGWTFQEGLLSRRRLVFTKTHTYFQCMTMALSSSIPLALSNGVSDTALPITGVTNIAHVFTEIGSGRDSLHMHMTNYCTRHLSFPSDALNAFLGIVHAFQEHESPVYNFWGIMMGKDVVSTARSRDTYNQDLDTGDTGKSLLQERSQDRSQDHSKNLDSTFLARLLWMRYSIDGLEPRQGLPSWTWVAWERREPFLVRCDTIVIDNLSPSIHLQRYQGDMVSLDTYVIDSRYELYKPLLYMTGWIGQEDDWNRWEHAKYWTDRCFVPFHERKKQDPCWQYLVIGLDSGSHNIYG